MSFLDEDELDPAPSGPSSRTGAERQRQLLVRRLIALAIGVGIILILVLLVNACLDNRKKRGFENYASDLGSIATQSNQLSDNFFQRLQNPSNEVNEVTLQAQIDSDRNTAEQLLDRVRALDVPDELAAAQGELEQAFELRSDAFAGVAQHIPEALNQNDTEAIRGLVGDMELFLASDVLYGRARGEINDGLAEEEVEESIPADSALPEPRQVWLDNLDLAGVLTNFATETGNAPPGTHGLQVLGASIGRTELSAELETSVNLGGDPPAVTAEIENGGDSQEKNVVVAYSLTGGPTPIEGEQEIPRIDASGISEVEFPPFETVPEPGTPMTLEVEVLPVIGEEIRENNRLTFPVAFD